MTIGENIKMIRKNQGISQKELADKMCVTSSQIYYYEKGLRNPSERHLQRFAEALGVSVDMILTDKSEEKKIENEPDKKKPVEKKSASKKNNFRLNDFQDKINHIGYHLDIKEDNKYYISNNKRKFYLTKEEIIDLNDKCDTYLKFLLSDY